MQSVLSIINTFSKLKFNHRSYFEIENGIQIGVKIGFDGIKIQASTAHIKIPLQLWYTIDMERLGTDTTTVFNLRMLDSGHKYHITRNSAIHSPDDAIRVIRDNLATLNVLSSFISIIHDHAQSISFDISQILENHCLDTANELLI